MKHTTEEKKRDLEELQQYRNQTLLAIVNSVSRSGMSRRIEFYAAGDDRSVRRIGYLIAHIIDWPYDVNKGGLLAKGCGMDMIFDAIYTFNIVSSRMENPTLDTKTLYQNANANGYFFPTRYDR